MASPSTADALARTAQALNDARLGALLIGPGADLRYLTGYDAPAMERPTMLVVRADDQHRLVVPRLERPRAAAVGLPEGIELVSYEETDNPFAILAAEVADVADADRLGIGDHVRAAFLLRLQVHLPGATWTPGSTVTAPLRMRKRGDELDALRRAAQAIDRVHARVPELLRPGRSEREVGRDIADAIVEEGHEEAAFVIVASGPNGASPHHELSDRTLAPGDGVVVDIGGLLDHYASDCTRNYVVGDPPAGYEDAHAALERAQAAAVESVRPGVRAREVDEAARRVLQEEGYGDAFVHRTGHGIGLEVHEEPYIVAGNDLRLEAGMVFSVEPGIYLDGRFGQRIEDIVAVTEDGVERLNTGDRALVRVPA